MKRGADLTDTGVHRLLQAILPGSRAAAFTLDRLMEASDACLSQVAASGSGAARLVAERIISCAREYQGWEAEHARLMQRVAAHRSAGGQKSALLGVALGLVHRKALFEHVRDKHVAGVDREALFAHFRVGNYASSCVQEHANFLRSAASLLCVRAIGVQLMNGPAFDLPLGRYQAAYARYFAACCQMVLHGSPQSRAWECTLKRQVDELRHELLGSGTGRSGIWKRPAAAT